MDHAQPRSTVDRPWTAAPGSPELRPPVSTGAGHGAGEEEWNAGSSVGGSPGHGRQCGGQASRQHGGGRSGSVGRRSGSKRRREELGEGWDAPGVLGGFYGGQGGTEERASWLNSVVTRPGSAGAGWKTELIARALFTVRRE
jgi:hypothetical protein